MSSARGSSRIPVLLFTLIGFAAGSGLAYQLISRDRESIASLRQTIHSLQTRLAAKDAELQDLRQPASDGAVLAAVFENAPNSNFDKTIDQPESPGGQAADQSMASPAPDWTAILKDLETVSDSDPRPFADKLKEFLTDNPDAETIAVATRGISDLAKDRHNLPDYALQSIYDWQSDPDLKRVIAQVLSQRGNNLLLENQIAEAQAQLKSDQPDDRRAALNGLAKTRSVAAVDAIAPYLQDPDTNVKLDALQALRETGNQKHIVLIETLVNDPDPAVSSLATDVQTQLRNLSGSARATISRADIEATLPRMQNPSL